MNTQRGFAFIPLLIGAAVLVSGAFFGPTTIARYHAIQGEQLLKNGKLEEAKQEFGKAADIAEFGNYQDSAEYTRKSIEIAGKIIDENNEQTRRQQESQKTTNTKKSSNVAGATTQRPAPPQGNKIDCTGPDGKHLQITQQECDNFNNAWANHKAGQESQQPPYYQPPAYQPNVPTYTNTYVDNSITCIVSYPCSGSNYTYRLLPSDCTDAQNRAAETCRLYPATTTTNLGTGSTFQLSPEVLHSGEAITNQSDAWVNDMTNKYGGKPGVTCSSQGVCPAPTPAGMWFDK